MRSEALCELDRVLRTLPDVRERTLPLVDVLEREVTALSSGHVLEHALIQAALHGRRAVAQLLLSKGPDLSVREPNWDNTALTAARWAKHADLVALLEPLTPTCIGQHDTHTCIS